MGRIDWWDGRDRIQWIYVGSRGHSWFSRWPMLELGFTIAPLPLAFRDRNLRCRPYAEIVGHPVSEPGRTGRLIRTRNRHKLQKRISFKNDLWEDLKFWSEKSWGFFFIKKKPQPAQWLVNPLKEACPAIPYLGKKAFFPLQHHQSRISRSSEGVTESTAPLFWCKMSVEVVSACF